jgi:hypothetical protein
MSDLLVVVDHVAQVVAAGVMRLAHAHRVVGQVDIAVVAEELRHGGAVAIALCSIWVLLDSYATAMKWSESRSRGCGLWMVWMSRWESCWSGGSKSRTQSRRLLHFSASDREVTSTFTFTSRLP